MNDIGPRHATGFATRRQSSELGEDHKRPAGAKGSSAEGMYADITVFDSED